MVATMKPVLRIEMQRIHGLHEAPSLEDTRLLAEDEETRIMSENADALGRSPAISTKNSNSSRRRRNKKRVIDLKQTQGGFPVPDGDSVLMCSVGGVSQIGMNWTLYGYRGRWILVDAGSAFAPRDIDGVEAIFPDPKSLSNVIPRLDALIVTHAHEDHIGAIHRLWPNIRCQIVATPFAAEVLKARFAERRGQGRVKMKIFKPGDKFNIGGFSVQTIRMTHSVPECVSLVLRTPAATIFHTGDWKFDANPIVGKPTDIARLIKAGNEGVSAMVCDSTNADREGKPTSESDLEAGMTAVMKDTKGMVAVACFATNVARLATVVRAAAASGRKVAISGRSLIKTEGIARKLGLLQGVPPILAESFHLKGLDRREMALICTGAQGEERAALSRLSVGDNWRLPKIEPGDAVIHSARVIPGNEAEVYRVFDRLREQGVTVHEGVYNDMPLHVTGHAVRGDLKRMYKYIRPEFAIPVHGTPAHLEAHAKLAKAMGVKDVAVPVEGAVFRVTREGVTLSKQVNINLVAELSVGAPGVYPDWDEAAFRAAQEAAADVQEADLALVA